MIEKIYIVMGMITYVSLVTIVYIVADGVRDLIVRYSKAIINGFKLIAGKRGGIYYMVNNRRRYI